MRFNSQLSHGAVKCHAVLVNMFSEKVTFLSVLFTQLNRVQLERGALVSVKNKTFNFYKIRMG